MGDGSGSKKQLGKIMLAQKLVTADELSGMLEEQEKRGGKLASTAIREGRITVTDGLRVLSEQHGVPAVDLRKQVVVLANLQLIPVELAREHVVLPVKLHGEQLLLPWRPAERDEHRGDPVRHGQDRFPHVELDEALQPRDRRVLCLLERGESHYVGDLVGAKSWPLGDHAPAPRSRSRAASTEGAASSRPSHLPTRASHGRRGAARSITRGGGPALDRRSATPDRSRSVGSPRPHTDKRCWWWTTTRRSAA